MDICKNKGAITVYLSIIMSAVIMLGGVLMDIVRIRAAETQVKRAVNTAAASVLAEYNASLKTQYGLFAVNNSDEAYLRDRMEDYLSCNLLSSRAAGGDETASRDLLKGIFIGDQYKDVRFIDLFNYRIEKIEITPIYNLTENEITRHQIIEYMKYRAPVQLTESFMKKLEQAAAAEEIADIYKQKTVIEKKLGRIEQALSALQSYINQMNKFDSSYYSLGEGNSKLKQLCQAVIQYEIYGICLAIGYGKASGQEEQKKLDKATEALEDRHKALGELQQRLEADMNDQLRLGVQAAEAAKQELQRIQGLASEVRQDMEVLKERLETSGSEMQEESTAETVKRALQQDIERYSYLLEDEESQSIAVQFESNLRVLSAVQSDLSSLSAWLNHAFDHTKLAIAQSIMAVKDGGGSAESIPEYGTLINVVMSDQRLMGLQETAKGYILLPNIGEEKSGKKGRDPRKSTQQAAKEIINDASAFGAASREIKEPQLLPSYSVNGSFPNKVFSGGVLQIPQDVKSKAIAGDDVDFDEDGSFVDKGFDFISSFAGSLREGLVKARDEIYVNEYVLKVFKDAVEIEASNTDNKQSVTYFDNGEVEYILWGQARENSNKLLVRAQILLVRFGMNTLHVYSDGQKRTQALEMAAAAAGFSGFGVPILHNLIMCAWGMTEAFYDLQDLYQGKAVPFIKDSRSWRTTLLPGGFHEGEKPGSSSDILDFDYHDYLRLFLLAEDTENKMSRIEDLIQLNTQQNSPGYRLSSSNTYIRVEAQVSINYWFITRLVMPSNKTAGNRHKIQVQLWRGY